jgi:hypothetical protein
MMLKTKYVYLKDLPRLPTYTRYDKAVCTSFLASLLGIANLTNKQVPSDLTDSNAQYNELISSVLGRFYEKPVGLILVSCMEPTPTADQLNITGEQFAYRAIAILNRTHERYMTLLTEYATAKTHLMDDVKSGTVSKRKHNDTPQNPNTLSPYEGDNYISDFTKFETDNKSEMATKMTRLAEISDRYENVMAEWVNEFQRIFMEEQL